jgi:hypothetical protein
MNILYCNLRLRSRLELEEVGKIVSHRVLGGIPFVAGGHSIRDEIPAIYTETEFLGMKSVLMGEPDEEGYYLTMDTRGLLATMSAEEIRKSRVNISSLVARLLEGVKDVTVVSENVHGSNPQ